MDSIPNGSDPSAFLDDKSEGENDLFDITIRNYNYTSNQDNNNHQKIIKDKIKSPTFTESPEIDQKKKKIFKSKASPPFSKKIKNHFLKKRANIDPAPLSSTPEMNQLNIPDFLQHSYINGIPEPSITKLRDWQIQLFQSPEWLFPPHSNKEELDSKIYGYNPVSSPDNPINSTIIKPKENYNSFNIGCSAIVLVPTSGGKTVAADVAISQLLATDPSAKAIYALPFVALANEKFSEFKKRYYKFSVRAFYQNIGGPDFRRGNIAICTYEKAHSIINSALIGKYADKIKLVVIDEIHMIGEEHRGSVIEALIVKLLLMQHQPRIIGLTATINISDAKLLSEWIRGFAFISDTRPSRVKQFMAKSNGDLHLIGKDGDIVNKIATLVKVSNNGITSASVEMFYVLDPIRRLLSRSPDSTVLIFVNRRCDTIHLGEFISKFIYDSKVKNLPQLQPASEELLTRRRTLVQDLARVSGFVDNPMKRCIINGIGIHHAGLLLEERKLIEAATRAKTLSVIVATTTLSAGINIHSVARVLIMSVFRWTPQKGQIPIPSAQFIQMVGRAGRSANRIGEAFVFAHSSMDNEINTIIDLSKQEIGNIVPHLTDEGELERFFLQCLSTKLIEPINGLEVFLDHTLQKPKQHPENASDSNPSFLDDVESEDEKLIERQNIIQRLVEKDLINSTSFLPTPLGRAIAGSSLTIEEGMSLYQTIQNIQLDLCLSDEIHLLYLCISPQIASLIQPIAYNDPIWIGIFEHHKHVIKLITGMDDRHIERMEDMPSIYGGLGRVNKKVDADLDRIFASVILSELINEVPVSRITHKYKIERGTVQSLQMQSATFAGQTSKFCEIIGSGLLATTLNRFRQRLNFAARTELLGLMVVPSITKDIARKLADTGVSSPIDLVSLSVEAVATLLVPLVDGKPSPPSEKELNLAKVILKDSKEYEESFTKLEILEESVASNI